MTRGTEILIEVCDITDKAWEGLKELTDKYFEQEDLHDLCKALMVARRALVSLDGKVLELVRSKGFAD